MMKGRRTRAVYVISVAAELAGMHPQTLRQYERRGLRQPGAHAGRQPPLLRRRHRGAAPCRRARLGGDEPRGHPPGDAARGRERPAARRAGGGARPRRSRPRAEAERRQRRDLVPLRQAVAVFGETPASCAEQRPTPGRTPELAVDADAGSVRAMALALADHLFAALPELRIHPTAKRDPRLRRRRSRRRLRPAP